MIRLLAALSLLLQLLTVIVMRMSIGATLRGELPPPAPEEVLLFLAPAILGCGGAAAAEWLRRRGSAWGWVVAGIPLALLLCALGLAVFLWFNPITHQR